MHIRFLSWLFICASLTFVSLQAQAPAAGTGPITGGAEVVRVAKVTGTVNMSVNGETTALKVDDQVPQAAKIVTAVDASIVLAFSNGATTQLGSDTELILEEFLQDPFASSVRVAAMTEEPSRSTTRLALNRGELVGNVKKLQHAKGSTFTITTPVGAAGIRGTTFRIVFRPAGGGQAFGAGPTQTFQFSLSTLEGDVRFQQGPSDPASAGAANTPANPGTAPAGVAVVTGQEMAVTVTATQTSQGQVVVNVMPPLPPTVSMPPATAALVSQAAQQIFAAAGNLSFQPGAGGPPPVAPASPAAAPAAPRTTPGDGR